MEFKRSKNLIKGNTSKIIFYAGGGKLVYENLKFIKAQKFTKLENYEIRSDHPK